MATKILKKKQLGVESVEPALTPPTPSDTTFLQKPKLGPRVKKKDIPEGMWTKCPGCSALIYDKELDENQKV